MRFSVTTGAAGPGLDPAGLARLAAQAEQAGWDAFFLEDYLVYQGRTDLPTYDPWVCLAAMATATSRIRIGTTVTPLPRRRPWKLASEAVSVDVLSGGRLILGVGSGDGHEPGFGAVGEPAHPRERAERVDEGLAIIAALWTGRPVHLDGTHYRVDGLRYAATPVQRPRIPIWIGGDLLAPGVRRRIARWDGCCAYKGPPQASEGPITPADVRELLAFVARERGTCDGFDMKVSGIDDPDGIAALADAGATWWGRWLAPGDPARIEDAILAGPPRG
ncbi:LLM class flavin-dependent oxidoreductase [Actinopolymorpha rutila]|uniref:Alkanesulfonate monooxygenase SsuD/methylene tetrahydromethanopterin reductase-like flavin-dependent oxidoreductase (Luciferase family) n=1 Tax=Actinopolymorpha rutila TaxID=446787 RepID=A0A852ZRD4_9ACTN|nr:LLM class flavin-dependent oxidoreductase [Actinopolymorpha rutila]NYH91959.1 alkanesulfonate monooxygenase SsuD/methylene tetrahydromethanopterin reductase-like flavin-dependent oxidoreductase (luciferase family) [Actinopolymorpha rutila]